MEETESVDAQSQQQQAAETSSGVTIVDGAATRPSVGGITKLPSHLVRRLVSGTAVQDLAGAVKELVDNALDACACTINIRLFGGGLEIIEVSDDGMGVPIDSRPLLAMPHTTSKISHVNQIIKSTPRTYGFRGEALFSLVSTSKQLIVATRTSDEDLATKLVFNRDGTLDTSKPFDKFHKKIGTTVAVVGFLANLPVRRNDLLSRIKQERGKLVTLIEQYAVFCTGRQIRLMDMVGNNCRESVLITTTLHSNTIQDTISTVLGPGILQSLCQIQIDLTDIIAKGKCNARGNLTIGDRSDEIGDDKDDDANHDSDDDDSSDDDDDDDDDSDDEDTPRYRVFGMISKAGGDGQSNNFLSQQQMRTRDRQYFCINGRPVDLPPVSKMLTQIWKALPTDSKRRKKPSCFLHLIIPSSTYDVNLSPDKRQVLLVHENEIIARLQEIVTQLWSSQVEGSFTMNSSASTAAAGGRNQQAVVNGEDYIDYDSLGENDENDNIDSQVDCAAPEDVSPSRFNRRYAFAHDIRNARLQHEFDDGRTVAVVQRPGNASICVGADYDEDRAGRTESSEEKKVEGENAAKRHEDDKCQTTVGDDGTFDQAIGHDGIKIPKINRLDQLRNLSRFAASTASASSDTKRRRLRLNLPVYDEDIKDDHSDKATNDENGAAPLAGVRHMQRLNEQRVHQSIITPSPDQDCEGFFINKTKKSCARAKIVGSQPGGSETNIPHSNDAALSSNSEFDQDEKARPQSLSERMSPMERHQWRRMQQAFNSGTSSGIEDDIQRSSLDSRVEPASGEGRMKNKKEASPATTLSFNQFGLERFGFGFRPETTSVKPVNSDTPPTTDEGAAIPSTSRSRGAILATPGTPNSSNFSQELSIEKRDIEDSLRTYKRERSSIFIHRQNDDDKIKENGEESKSDLDESARTMKQLNSGDANPRGDVVDTGDCDDTEYEAGAADYSASEEIVWDAFQGTEHVIGAWRSERLAMRDRKRKLLAHQKLSVDLANDTQEGGFSAPQHSQSTPGNSIRLVKNDFGKMTIIGQFNLGFIVARTPDNNIWVLDQHACDEKYNFEKLCVETVIHEQRLLAPMPLELSPAEESCVLDHMDLFEKNGFRFDVNLDKPPRHRLALTALPHSGAREGRKAVQFGKEDVAALCSILGVDESSSSYDGASGGTGADGSGMHGNNAVRRYAGASTGRDTAEKVIARLPKAIAMFASRACRGSIMIGKALSNTQMDQIVKRMKDVENPWNCPHGRPTMRHVANVHSFLRKDEQKATSLIANTTGTFSSQDDEEIQCEEC